MGLKGNILDYIIPVKNSINRREIKKNVNYDFLWKFKNLRIIIEQFLKNEF